MWETYIPRHLSSSTWAEVELPDHMALTDYDIIVWPRQAFFERYERHASRSQNQTLWGEGGPSGTNLNRPIYVPFERILSLLNQTIARSVLVLVLLPAQGPNKERPGPQPWHDEPCAVATGGKVHDYCQGSKYMQTFHQHPSRQSKSYLRVEPPIDFLPA